MSSRSLTSCLVLLALGLVSCRDGGPSGDRRKGAPLSPRPTTEVSAATQLDFAHELDAIERSADPRAELVQLRSRWQGRHLEWTVTRQAVFCQTAARCNVIPFAAPRAKEVANHGWLPTLAFAPGQWDKLAAGCAGATPCELTFEGDLTTLVVSDELPTSLGFSNVSIVTAVAAPSAAPQHAAL